MVEGLLQGVAEAIRTRYGVESYTVYTEAAPQTEDKAAFFLQVKKQEVFPGFNRRFREDDTLEVCYVPLSELEPNAECRRVEVDLTELLSLVETESGPVRGLPMSSRVEEGRLYVEAVYRFYLYREKEPDVLMQEVTVYGQSRS